MSIRKSLVITSIDKYLSLIVNVISTMVLARLLTPSEVGAFSVAMVLISAMSMMRGMGACHYLIQEKDLTLDRKRAVWTVQFGLGVLLAMVVAGMAVPASHFYKDERVRDILFVLAGNFLITPFGLVTSAWLTREMRFVPLAVMQFSYTVANALVSIWLAWRGWGAISLAWGNLAATVANALVAIYYRPAHLPWIPGIREVRRVLAFGARVSSSWLAETLARSAPEFFLGNLQSLAAAGFYSRANGLVSLFTRLVSEVAGTVVSTNFAKQAREQRDTRPMFLLSLTHLTALSWSFAGFLAFMAAPVIRLLYGEQWSPSAPLVSWLALALGAGIPMVLCQNALTGLGAATQLLHGGLVSAVLTAVLALVGASIGLEAVAMGALAASVLSSLFWLRCSRRVIGFSWADIAPAVWRSAVVALGASVGPALVYWIYGAAEGKVIAALAWGSAGWVTGFIVTAWWLDHPLYDELRRLGRRLRPAAALPARER